MKKTAKWIVIALAAALAFVACKNIEEGGEIQQPPAPEQGSGGNPGGNGGESSGGEQKPGGSENPSGEEGEQKPGDGGNEGEEGNEGGSQGGESGGEQNPTPENPTTKAASDLLKEILTETEYNKISEELSSKGITLTAQTIKEIGDNFSVLVKDAENGAAQDATKGKVNSNKEAFVAQDKNLINVTKTGNGYSLSYNTNVVFSGEFNLDEISLPDNNGKGNFTNATLKGAEISINKVNTIRGDSLPKLSFSNVTPSDNFSAEETSFYLYKLYKDYSANLGKLEISGNMSGFAVDVAKNKDGNFINGYTLFNNDDTAKSSSDPSIKSLTADALIQMYTQLKIADFSNMIIYGKPKEAIEVVNWDLTNMVFEEDMNNIKIKINSSVGGSLLTGIVYFKGKPYNNINSNSHQSINGLLKLDSLNGVSYSNFGITLTSNSAVLDVRGVDKDSINNYNEDAKNNGILAGAGDAHAIYFNKDFSDIKDKTEEINKLCLKFSKRLGVDAGFVNVYLEEDRVNGEYYGEILNSVIGAKNPRKLKEFEYFGNYGKFEKSAKETYGNDFDGLEPFERGKLNSDVNNQIAQTNKRIDFIDPETQKIIFSLANDRQYNS